MTSLERAGLARLMLRRPAWRSKLRERSHQPILANLCEAYELSSEAALHWGNSFAPNALEIAGEYRALMSDIEEDVGQALDVA